MNVFIKEHWKGILNLIIVPIVSFVFGLQMRQIKLKQAETEVQQSSYNAEYQKINNFSKVLEINGEMIEQIKSDFADRTLFLNTRIKEVEENNVLLKNLVQTQKQIIAEHQEIIEKQEKVIKKYRRKYGTIKNG
ncbi:hypothetical protein [Tenacibaculum sp. 190524A02b]|uniref:hypothetical protein n=1 Tax=Tenacibaculum vairaonense TaxID=3137860 RepID=UPI0031FAF85E